MGERESLETRGIANQCKVQKTVSTNLTVSYAIFGERNICIGRDHARLCDAGSYDNANQHERIADRMSYSCGRAKTDRVD